MSDSLQAGIERGVVLSSCDKGCLPEYIVVDMQLDRECNPVIGPSVEGQSARSVPCSTPDTILFLSPPAVALSYHAGHINCHLFSSLEEYNSASCKDKSICAELFTVLEKNTAEFSLYQSD